MSGIASKVRRNWIEVAWAAFALANLVLMLWFPKWETIPFHFVWVSLTLVYGLRVWRARNTSVVLTVVTLLTGAAIVWTSFRGHEQLDEIAEVPLMAAMFVAMVWHARREQAAMEEVRRLADSEHRLLERQRDFVRDASHELRTPITVARGHTELIRASAAGPQIAEDAEIVLDELSRLSRIAERLLILAAAEHPDFLSIGPVRVERLVVAAGRRWIPTAPRDWRVEAAVAGLLMADEERLATALDALIENAVKFTREHDLIVVSAVAEGDALVVEVSDGGVGIPREDVERVFDRFARADRDRTRGSGGTGLGLAIVKAIVDAHGGSVAVESTPGRGTTFRVRLPGFRSDPAVVVEEPEPAGPAPVLTR